MQRLRAREVCSDVTWSAQVWQIYEPSFLARLETLFRYLHILSLSFGPFAFFAI
jgi:hypothetical protein